MAIYYDYYKNNTKLLCYVLFRTRLFMDKYIMIYEGDRIAAYQEHPEILRIYFNDYVKVKDLQTINLLDTELRLKRHSVSCGRPWQSLISLILIAELYLFLQTVFHTFSVYICSNFVAGSDFYLHRNTVCIR